jgi:uncharacterized protein YebE (UPF0316 family)
MDSFSPKRSSATWVFEMTANNERRMLDNLDKLTRMVIDIHDQVISGLPVERKLEPKQAMQRWEIVNQIVKQWQVDTANHLNDSDRQDLKHKIFHAIKDSHERCESHKDKP